MDEDLTEQIGEKKLPKVTKIELLGKILKAEHEKVTIETIDKILKGSKKGSALKRSATIIDNIDAILQDLIEKIGARKIAKN